MAQAIHCDAHNREHLADVLVSQIANGDTAAFCFAGYVDVCRALVEDVEARAAEAAKAAAAEAERSGAADQAEGDLTDAEVLARLGQAPGPDPFVGQPTEAEAEAHDAYLDQPPAVDPTPAQVVRRGTSRSRRAHEARQKAAKSKVAPEATPPDDAAQASTGEPTEDLGGSERPA